MPGKMKHIKQIEIFLNEDIVTEAKYDKKKLLKAIENSDDAMILVKGKEYIIYNPDNGNDDNAAMWGDKTIMALDQDGGEHEFKYSDIERFSESVVNEGTRILDDQDTGGVSITRFAAGGGKLGYQITVNDGSALDKKYTIAVLTTDQIKSLLQNASSVIKEVK